METVEINVFYMYFSIYHYIVLQLLCMDEQCTTLGSYEAAYLYAYIYFQLQVSFAFESICYK